VLELGVLPEGNNDYWLGDTGKGLDEYSSTNSEQPPEYSVWDKAPKKQISWKKEQNAETTSSPIKENQIRTINKENE